MSIFDNLRRRNQPDNGGARPAPRTGNTRSESGRGQRYGLLNYDDHNLDLVGVRGVMEMDRIWRSDPDARRIILMLVVALIGGTITVEPAGGEEATDQDVKVAEFVEWALFEEMNPRLPSHLFTALTVTFRNGRVPFEITHRLAKRDGRDVWVIDELGIILPRSITYWNTSPDNPRRLASITQQAAYGTVDVPIEDLILYRVGAEGDNWEGESLLRAAYRNVEYKADLELIDAQGHERFNMGIPIAYPPQEVQDDDLDAVEEVLQNLRAGAESYIVAPGPSQEHAGADGWLFDILVPKATGGSARNIVDSINHHRASIDASVIAEFMRLGQKETGARATADVQQNPFLQLAETLAGILIEDTINQQLIPRLVDLNFQVEAYPRLTVSLIDSTSLTDLATYAKTLSDAGILHADNPTEDYFRERGDLPAADPEARKAREEQAQALEQAAQKAANEPPSQGPQQDPSQQQEQPPGRKLTLRADRPLKAWEAQLSLDRIESAIDTARDQFVTAISGPAHKLAARLAAMDQPDAPAVRDPDMLAAIRHELRRLYDLGYSSVVEELTAQATTPTQVSLAAPPDEPPDDTELRLRSENAVDNITAQMLTDLRRANQMPLVRDPTAQAALQAAAEAGARAGARAEATANASAVIGLGRRAAADDNTGRIKGARYTSILDNQRCSQCAAADDDVLRPLDDPVRLSRIPPNPACLGRGACRCLEFFELM